MSGPTAAFAGDAHLRAEDPAGWSEFFAFLRGPAREAERLYLLGDVFHAWAGDDDRRELASTAREEIAAVVRSGTDVGILGGNHDFMLGGRFCSEVGAQYCGLEHVAEIGSQRLLLLHGDVLCPGDAAYQRIRRIWARAGVRRALAMLPLGMRIGLASRLSAGAGLHSADAADLQSKLAVDEGAAQRLLEKADAAVLVHGHTHAPGIFACGSRQRACVPAWPAGGGLGGWAVLLQDGTMRIAGP